MSPKCYFSTLTRFVACFAYLAKLMLRTPLPVSQSSVNKSVCCLNPCYFFYTSANYQNEQAFQGNIKNGTASIAITVSIGWILIRLFLLNCSFMR